MPSRVEFLSATNSRFYEDEIFYDTSIFPLEDKHKDLLPNEADLSFNSFDRTVTIGTQRADIARVASIARKFAEWEYAFHVKVQYLSLKLIAVTVVGEELLAYLDKNKLT